MVQTWRWTSGAKPPLHWRFSAERSPRYKSESWKAGRRKKERAGPSILIQTASKRERKVWTKGKERHKRRWIIQYAPLVDSFVILYNGQLENNHLIAWKRSLFSATLRVNVMRKWHNVVSDLPSVHINGPWTLLAVNKRRFFFWGGGEYARYARLSRQKPRARFLRSVTTFISHY